jgi:predicted transcriptional regulator
MEKRATRSQAYQFLMVESLCSNEMMEAFSNEDSISNRLNPYHYDERIIDLEEQLKEEFWRIVENLTPRQKEVIKLSADGYTQMEIAKMLNVNQSSVTKSIHGNVDYKKGKKIYGGSKKKLSKIIESDTKIKAILDEMASLRENKW